MGRPKGSIKKYKKICPECNKLFIVPGRFRRKKYCCLACAHEGRKKNWGKAMSKWAEENPERMRERNKVSQITRKLNFKSSKIQKICPYCNKKFYCYKHKKFCSQICAQKFQKAQIKIVKKKCRYCGKLFDLTGKDKRKIFCSKECAYKGRKHAYGYKCPNSTGPKNCNWNAGTAKLKYKGFIRNGKHYYVHIENCLKKLGLSSLPAGHCVHHIDRDRFNNAPENLQLMTIEDHNKLHADLMRKPNMIIK